MQYYFPRFPDGKAKAVTLSYDDGYETDIRMAQTLERYGMKGTFNINSAYIGISPRATKEEIQTHLLDHGHEIAVHGACHKAPGLVRTADGLRDVYECRLALEQSFGCIVRGMAYPDSGIHRMINDASLPSIYHYLNELGIVYARTLGSDNNGFRLPQDWLAWMPTCIHQNPNALAYAKEFVNLKPDAEYFTQRDPRLFFLWGHSIDFERENNWALLDQLCEILSGQDDVWYATNIEIYDYMTAYNKLVFSLDNSLVYNPSLCTVWFVADDKLYSVKPGETLKLDK